MADFRYVFLIGAARSGTKFLRDTLSTSADVCSVPYDINYVWRHGNETCPHDELTPDDISQKQANHIRRSVTRLALKNQERTPKIILEKTVSNTLRTELIRKVFPEAEFIYLERNGLDVVESAYRQWTAEPNRSYLLEKLRYFPIREWRYALWFGKNLLNRNVATPVWGPRYDGIENDLYSVGVAQTCALQWKRSVESARRTIDQSNTTVVRYEELDDEDKGVSRAIRALELSDGDAIQAPIQAKFQRVQSWPGQLPSSSLSTIEATVRITGNIEGAP